MASPSQDPFTGLPSEMLERIFLDVSRSDLVSLLNTHPTFKIEAERILYRDVCLSIRRPILANWTGEAALPRDPVNANVCEAFLDTMKNTPALAGHVQRLSVNCYWKNGNEDLFRVKDILARLPKLQELAIILVSRKDKPPCNWTYYKSLWYMIKRFSIPKVIIGSVSALDTQTIMRLTIHADKNLTYLSTTLHENSSPPDLIALLSPASSTLEVLELQEESVCNSHQADVFVPTPGDFSAFVALRRLSVPYTMWFSRGSCDSIYNYNTLSWRVESRNNFSWRVESRNNFSWRVENRMGLFRNLSPNIKDLSIQFRYPDGVFASGANYHDQFVVMPEMTQIKSCAWILELVQHRARLPCLKSVSLIEETYGPGSGYNSCKGHHSLTVPYKVVEYTPPQAVRDVFNAVGVTLKIELVVSC